MLVSRNRVRARLSAPDGFDRVSCFSEVPNQLRIRSKARAIYEKDFFFKWRSAVPFFVRSHYLIPSVLGVANASPEA